MSPTLLRVCLAASIIVVSGMFAVASRPAAACCSIGVFAVIDAINTSTKTVLLAIGEETHTLTEVIGATGAAVTSATTASTAAAVSGNTSTQQALATSIQRIFVDEQVADARERSLVTEAACVSAQQAAVTMARTPQVVTGGVCAASERRRGFYAGDMGHGQAAANRLARQHITNYCGPWGKHLGLCDPDEFGISENLRDADIDTTTITRAQTLDDEQLAAAENLTRNLVSNTPTTLPSADVLGSVAGRPALAAALAEQASISAATAPLEWMIALRKKPAGTADGDTGPAALSVIERVERDITRRFGSEDASAGLEYQKQLAAITTSEGLLRELIQVQNLRNWLNYQALMQDQFMTVQLSADLGFDIRSHQNGSSPGSGRADFVPDIEPAYQVFDYAALPAPAPDPDVIAVAAIGASSFVR